MDTQKSEGKEVNGKLLVPPRHLEKSGRTYYVWRPFDLHDLHPLIIGNADFMSMMGYKEFHLISLVEHISDFKISQKYRTFFPNHLSYCNTHLTSQKVTWFGPRTNPYEHNFYGNVSYKISMKSFMDYMKTLPISIYFVEIVDFKCSSASRFLFSYKKYDHLHIYDPKQKGGAWYENENGEHFFLESLKRYYQPEYIEIQSHELEIMLELRDADYCKVFELCETEAVNHIEANEMDMYGKPKRKRCKKHQTSDCGDMKDMCPSDWFISQTELEMEILKQENNDKSSVLDENKNSDIDSDSESDIYYKPKRKRCKTYKTNECGDIKEICPSGSSIAHTEMEKKSFKQKQIEAPSVFNENSDIDSNSESDSCDQPTRNRCKKHKTNDINDASVLLLL